MKQQEFEIGGLDLSKLVGWGRSVKANGFSEIDEANAKTLKHHAEAMIAAGEENPTRPRCSRGHSTTE